MSYDPGETFRTIAQQEAEVARLTDLVAAQKKVIADLVWSHRAHGPCNGNSCDECQKAYANAKYLMRTS